MLGEVCQELSKWLMRGFDLKEVSREAALLDVLLKMVEMK